MKVSKEEIIAVLTALDLFASGAYDAQNQEFRSWLESMGEALELANVNASCYLVIPEGSERWPTLEIQLDEAKVGTAFEVCQKLRQGSPPIYVGHARLHEGMLTVNPHCMTAEGARTLTARLCELLK